jgi:tRNA G18 (ribose-2'-O)-methylase SpoU
VLGIPVVVPDRLADALDELRSRGWRTVGADAGAPADYTAADLRGLVALVVGGETHGLPPELDAVIDTHVQIPMAGPTESLNVGVAASILLFEAARQTRG